jgi:hypothetical protein
MISQGLSSGQQRRFDAALQIGDSASGKRGFLGPAEMNSDAVLLDLASMRLIGLPHL